MWSKLCSNNNRNLSVWQIASLTELFRGGKLWPLLNINIGRCHQCDQIGQFFGLWATFLNMWQQLVCPNLPHS